MYRSISALAVLSLVGCSGPSSVAAPVHELGEQTALTAGDREALRALDQSYAKAWLKKDAGAQSKALLALFADDAVIYPSGGGDPVVGVDALHHYWFGQGRPLPEIEYFRRHADIIEGSPALGAVTGGSEIAFTYDGKRYAREGHYIIHARPDADGYWKITRMMWSNRAAD